MSNGSVERFAFPMDCPDCKASSGYPYEAATVRGTVTLVRIGLRCRDCRHEWRLELDTDPIPETGIGRE